ncbi:MAG: AI-2E family transporter [Gemmatimonadetes bacterium]|nr:AI-2E family transporter [Gemmatimonadota bacterium]
MSTTSASAGRIARNVLIALGLTGLALLLWAGRDILFILFFGLLVGILFGTFTGWLEDLGLKRILALIVVLLVSAALTAGFWILLWPPVSDQLSTVGRELPQAADRVMEWVDSQYRSIAGPAGAPEEGLEEEVRTRARNQMGSIVSGALPIINSVIGALAGFLLVLVVGIYTAASPGMYRRGMLQLVPPRHRDRVTDAMDRSGHSLRRWMIGSAVNMLGVGLLIFLGLMILDVPAALALAIIAGLFEFVPIVGPILSAVPAIVVALTVSPTTALWVVLLFVVVQQIEGNLLTPLVMRGAVHLPPALTILFQALMAAVFGFLGLLLAVPILAVVLEAVRTLYVEPMQAHADRG